MNFELYNYKYGILDISSGDINLKAQSFDISEVIQFEANDISNIHSKHTGANTFFAQVIFQKNEKNPHFMGGKLVKTKEIFLNGQIQHFGQLRAFR